MLRHVVRAFRSRPKTTLLVVLVLIIVAAVSVPAYALHQWHQAKAALENRQYQQALDHLGICLFVWPNSTEVHFLTARAARLAGDFPVAEVHLNKCRELERGATEAIQLEFLLMRAQTGEVDEVAGVLFDAIDRGHADAELIFECIARAYMHRLRYGPAYGCLTRWMKEHPNNPRPWQWRGWVLERMNNAPGAMGDYLKALELDPTLSDVRLRVVEMLLEDRKPVEALVHLEKLRQDHPERADVKARLGQCYYLQGKAEDARTMLEAAVKELPNDSPLLLHLARLELQQSNPQKAEEWLRKSLKVDPADIEAQYTLVLCLQAQGRREEAADVLKTYQANKTRLDRANDLLIAEAKSPTTDPDAPAEIGSLLMSIGHDRLAVYWLEQAIVRDPNHQESNRLLAEYYERIGDTERAAVHRSRLSQSTTSSRGGSGAS